MPHQYIGYRTTARGSTFIQAFSPVRQVPLEARYPVATREEVDEAMWLAQSAFPAFRQMPGARRAAFLRAIADEIEALGDRLVETACLETGLPEGRIKGERGRTCGQLRFFADIAEEGSWCEAIIDTARPDATPPRPDIRRMLVPMGPVVVFGASNFPLAFSTAGGDTASALATGNPVVVKAHELHPGTHALVAEAIVRAARHTDMPEGVFSALYGRHEVGQWLVQHEAAEAVAFTGSYGGGMALYRLAQQRPRPIPVFAEMGSINPVFVTPEALEGDAEGLARQLAASVTLGAGQFCTNPGLIVVFGESQTNEFARLLATALAEQPEQVMLAPAIYEHYEQRRQEMQQREGVEVVYAGRPGRPLCGCATVVRTTADRFLREPALQEEVFGPFTMVVQVADENEALALAHHLQGQLTATLMVPDTAAARYARLRQVLEQKAGRIIFNGVPTGVAVVHAMQHGGPFPATTDSRFTSVGGTALRRFVRPVAWQAAPHDQLPPELQDHNPLGILRLVDGTWTQAPLKR